MKKLILFLSIILSLGLCVAVADENNSVKSLWQQFTAEQKIKNNEIGRIIKARSEGAKKLEKGLTKRDVEKILGAPNSVFRNKWWYDLTELEDDGVPASSQTISILFNADNKIEEFLVKDYWTINNNHEASSVKNKIVKSMSDDAALYQQFLAERSKDLNLEDSKFELNEEIVAEDSEMNIKHKESSEELSNLIKGQAGKGLDICDRHYTKRDFLPQQAFFPIEIYLFPKDGLASPEPVNGRDVTQEIKELVEFRARQELSRWRGVSVSSSSQDFNLGNYTYRLSFSKMKPTMDLFDIRFKQKYICYLGGYAGGEEIAFHDYMFIGELELQRR